MQNLDLSDFISQHRLPEKYIQEAQRWFLPVADTIAEQQKNMDRTVIIGINGAQGSGKSTLADLLALMLSDNFQLNVVVLSIDDFYFTRQQREILSKTVHPLLATRGVPGTHDVGLAIHMIQSLCAKGTTSIPHFDKSIDDRFPEGEWDQVISKPDVILFEGWCLGAEPQSEEELLEPVNELEKNEDSNGSWRQYVNQQLRDSYPELFNMVDFWIMLKAPSFNCVYQWRLEQENKLGESLSGSTSSTDKLMCEQGIKHFIQHYQRITEHLLETLPDKVDHLFELDEHRKIIKTRRMTKD
ncbi:MAG: kinase [Gammaproteobacteria bacterium]|nr:MAG: kinase [Gammaproteobacteria bacterium]